jgi:hypothetical protein
LFDSRGDQKVRKRRRKKKKGKFSTKNADTSQDQTPFATPQKPSKTPNTVHPNMNLRFKKKVSF